MEVKEKKRESEKGTQGKKEEEEDESALMNTTVEAD